MSERSADLVLRPRRTPLWIAALFALLVAAPASAQDAPKSAGASGTTDASSTDKVDELGAEERLRESIRVFVQRPVPRAGRVELQLMGGLGIADTLQSHASVSGNFRVHLIEELSIGVHYSHFFGDSSPLRSDVIANYGVFPEESLLRWYAGADIGFMFAEGKFAAFENDIVHFDMSITLGGGVMQTSRSADFKGAGTVALSGRLWLARWVAIVMEVRDIIYYEDFNAGGQLMNEFLFQGGFTFFLPPEPSYRYPK